MKNKIYYLCVHLYYLLHPAEIWARIYLWWTQDEWKELLDDIVKNHPGKLIHITCGWSGDALTKNGKCPKCGEDGPW